MAEQIIKIPDLGDTQSVEVIEVLVKAGDSIEVDQPLFTLEGEKATMDVPSPYAGVIKEVLIKVGDTVSEGSEVAVITSEAADDQADQPKATQDAASTTEAESAEREEIVTVPDLGDSDEVEVIEIVAKVGDTVAPEQALVTLESEKATMDVPAPTAGEVLAINVKVGDKVRQGSEIAILKVTGGEGQANKPAEKAASPTPAKPVKSQSAPAAKARPDNSNVYASPSVRRVANELEIDLSKVKGTGEKGRITKDDVKNYLSQGGGAGIPKIPAVDFSKYGQVETKPLNKIKRLTGQNLQRNWLNIPHVTQFGEAYIDDLEAHRKSRKSEAEKLGLKLTPLVFIMKAVVAALKAYPQFNSSLDESGKNLIYKHYFHIGVAVDTPNGLVVPVIRDVDQKDLLQLAKELGEISLKAREKGLSPQEMQGGCFTISSLGGIGGTAFTPIVNAPEAAILGVSRAAMKPIYDKETNQFVSKLTLPLALSYDHRIIDGADGARFIVHLSESLTDISRLI